MAKLKCVYDEETKKYSLQLNEDADAGAEIEGVTSLTINAMGNRDDGVDAKPSAVVVLDVASIIVIPSSD